MSQEKKIELYIQGMHCQSCEILIEDRFQKIPGVRRAKVKYAAGKAIIFCSREPHISEFQNAVKMDGYAVSKNAPLAEIRKNSKRDYLEIGAILIILFGLYLFFKQTGILDFNLAASENMSYGLIFLIGLVAASSTCLAVSGGVLLSVAAKYNETHAGGTRFERFKPHLLFNIGRIVSYTILGGVIGAIGSALSFSPRTTGLITLAAAFFMIIMGFRILNILPWLSKFSLRMPKFIGRKILKMESGKGRTMPFLAGALTFFLPCGFTQAFQLYAVSRGSFTEGALTMFFFSLGTLPALLSLGAVSSFAKGTFSRLFLKFSGVLVLVLGFYNVSNGLALTGNPLNLASVLNTEVTSARIENGKQIVKMSVDWSGYNPNKFTVKQGIPVQWEITGTGSLGCQNAIIMPQYNITKFIAAGKNIVEFTPREAGKIPFSCSMGMYRGSFTVLPNNSNLFL